MNQTTTARATNAMAHNVEKTVQIGFQSSVECKASSNDISNATFKAEEHTKI
jgi:hypothetical protein